MPRALGYVSVPPHLSATHMEQAVVGAGQALAAFAEREGLTLAGVFSDVRGRSEQGFNALLAAIRHQDAAAVVVLDASHLEQIGCLAGADTLTVSRYLQSKVLAVHPGPGDAS